MGLMDKIKNPSKEQVKREQAAASKIPEIDDDIQKRAMAAAVMNTQHVLEAERPLQGATALAPTEPAHINPMRPAKAALPAPLPNEKDDPVYSLVTSGDLSGLTPTQRLQYYHRVCQDNGLNPLTKPFDFIKLNGKLILYATKDCAAQLSKLHRVTVKITQKEQMKEAGILMIWATASTPDGRSTDNVGSVVLWEKTKGEDAANAWMKGVTKASRRSVLAHCGLGYLDESEVEENAGVERVVPPPADNGATKALAAVKRPLAPPQPVAVIPEQAVEIIVPTEPAEDGQIIDSDGAAEGGADQFDFGALDHRQWLIKEIRARFDEPDQPNGKPGKKFPKESLQQLGQTYQHETSRAAIIADLDKHSKQRKAAEHAVQPTR